jgi:hypothetical protein
MSHPSFRSTRMRILRRESPTGISPRARRLSLSVPDVQFERPIRPSAGPAVIVATVLGALTVALGAACLIPNACGSFHDDGIYVVTAKALAEGRGYRLINLPGSPAQTKYPILYPALLSVVWKAWPSFPENLAAMHALTLLMAGAAVGLFYAYLMRYRYFTSHIAATACLLCATSPAFLYFANRLLSEMPFALLLVLSLWVFESLLQSPRASRSRQFISGLALALPYLCRGAGISVIPAFLWLGWHHRRPLRWASMGMFAITLPWAFWVAINHGEAKRNPILGYYTDYLGWWNGVAPWESAGRLFLTNIGLVAVSIPSVIFGGNTFAWKNRIAGILAAFVLGMVTLTGMARMVRTSRCLPVCLSAYLSLVLAWPWPPLRFLVPIAPVLAAVLLSSAAAILRRFLSDRPARLIFSALVLLAIAGNLWSLARVRDFSLRLGYPVLSAPTDHVDWSSYERVFAWIRNHTKPDDVIASAFDPTIYLYTGRPAFRPFVARPLALFYGQDTPGIGTFEDLDRSLKAFRARYLVQTPAPAFAEEKPFHILTKELRQQEPGRLKRVYTGEDPRFVIYSIDDRVSESDRLMPLTSRGSANRSEPVLRSHVEKGAEGQALQHHPFPGERCRPGGLTH